MEDKKLQIISVLLGVIFTVAITIWIFSMIPKQNQISNTQVASENIKNDLPSLYDVYKDSLNDPIKVKCNNDIMVLFNDYNRDYFNSSLRIDYIGTFSPEYDAEYAKLYRPWDKVHVVYAFFDFGNEQNLLGIMINESILENSNELKRHLLHEMVHLEDYLHNPKDYYKRSISTKAKDNTHYSKIFNREFKRFKEMGIDINQPPREWGDN